MERYVLANNANEFNKLIIMIYVPICVILLFMIAQFQPPSPY